MILVILGIGLILLTIGIIFCVIQESLGYYIKGEKISAYARFKNWLYNNEWTYWVLNIIGGSVATIALIATLCFGITVSGLSVVDEKITMYQEENTKIEEEISTMVEQYQKYETDIFTEVKPESSMTLVSLYPELKADTLVQKQIEVYTENNFKIKELKEEKITGSVSRWWLYFGK